MSGEKKNFTVDNAVWEPGKCRVCGGPIPELKHGARNTCCLEHAEIWKAACAAYRLSGSGRKVLICRRCGAEFEPRRGRKLTLCSECDKYLRRCARRREEEAKNAATQPPKPVRPCDLARRERDQQELKSLTVPPRRRCHDCGKPTNDYRCPKCLAKWRIKHGVPVNTSKGWLDDYEASEGKWK